MTKLTTIKAGYRLTVVSWENDGDNYNTKVIEGLTKEETTFFIGCCKVFSSKNRDKNNIGNMYAPSYKEIEQFVKVLKEVAVDHSYIVLSDKYSHYFKYNDDEEFTDSMHEMLYDFGLTSGEFYTRVCESYKVDYTPHDIHMHDVTEEFV